MAQSSKPWPRPAIMAWRESVSGRAISLASPVKRLCSGADREVEADVQVGKLQSVLDDYIAPPNGIYAVFAQRKHLPLRLRLWIDFVKQAYGDPTYWRAAP